MIAADFHWSEAHLGEEGDRLAMNVIYVDTLFLLNAVIDYLLLLASAKLAGEPLCRVRFGLGALLGGGYAVALFLPGMGFLYHPLCRIAAAVLMVLTAFSKSRRLLRQILIFFALACGFGGGVLAVSLLGGRGLTLGAGVFYSSVDLKIVLASAAGCYGILTLLFHRWGRHSLQKGELEQITLRFFDEEIALTALRDTGNTLTDPVSGRPALVAHWERLEELFRSGGGLGRDEVQDPVGALERLNRQWPGRFRLLPYRAVGVDRGLLLAVRVDEVRVGGEVQRGVLVAISPNPVSDGGNYQVLAGAI